MNADRGNLAAFADRNHDQVERDPAMDRRLALGLGHQRVLAAVFEVAHGVEAPALVGRRARDAEDAERVGRRFVRPFDVIAEQRHVAVGEPVEQGGAFGVRDLFRVRAHLALELGPVADGEPDVVEHALEVGGERLAVAGVDPVELEVHHRFAPLAVGAQQLDLVQRALVVAADAHDRMEQAVDGDLAAGDGVGDRIDQERHVVVDDRDPHPPPPGFAAGRLDRDLDFAGFAASGDLGEELGGLALGFTVEAAGFAGECVSGQRLAN